MTKNIYEQIQIANKNRPIYIENCDFSTKITTKPIIINWRTINKILKKHNISTEELYLLHEQITENILIAHSLTQVDSIIIYIKQWDNQGRPIMLSLSLEECDAEIKVYKITSIYGRNKTEDFIKRLYEENKIISFNREGLLWLQAIGISLPNGLYNVNHLCDREYRFSVGVFIIKKINSLHRTTIVQGLR